MHIKNNFIVLPALLTFVVIGILTWAPWLQDEEVKNIVRSDKTFQKAHPDGSTTANPEINIHKIPFGRYITTYEQDWFVWFWQSKETDYNKNEDKISQQGDCASLKKNFDSYVERRYLPIIEDPKSLCHGLNLGIDFSKLSPKWAAGELIAIRGPRLTFEGILQDATIQIDITDKEVGKYKIGENYKIDMNNICREIFLMAESRSPSPIGPTFVMPEKISCE